MRFEWDFNKNRENIVKHGISFEEARIAFSDEKRFVEKDVKHSTLKEERYFLYGDTGKGIATVRFTIRDNTIRLIGAGYWREGRNKYEKR